MPGLAIVHHMSKTASNKTHATPAVRAQPARISAKLRRAIDLIATQGLTQREAAHRAGLHEVSLSKAIAKPHVRLALDDAKANVCLEADNLKGLAKALAIRTGIELMQESPSHAVRAKMVEFFAGEARTGTQVNVAVNVDRGGYEFVRPGQRIVDITPVPDTASGGDDAQAIDDAGE